MSDHKSKSKSKGKAKSKSKSLSLSPYPWDKSRRSDDNQDCNSGKKKHNSSSSSSSSSKSLPKDPVQQGPRGPRGKPCKSHLPQGDIRILTAPVPLASSSSPTTLPILTPELQFKKHSARKADVAIRAALYLSTSPDSSLSIGTSGLGTLTVTVLRGTTPIGPSISKNIAVDRVATLFDIFPILIEDYHLRAHHKHRKFMYSLNAQWTYTPAGTPASAVLLTILPPSTVEAASVRAV